MTIYKWQLRKPGLLDLARIPKGNLQDQWEDLKKQNQRPFPKRNE